MANDPYTDDEYDDTYQEVHGDEPARDRYADETDDGFFPYNPGWGVWPTGWGYWPARDADDAEEEYGYDERGDYDRAEDVGAEDEDSSWLDEGLIATVLLVGVVLFIFPEPATSAAGIALVAMGVVAWIADWAM